MDKRSFVVYAEVIEYAGDLTDEQLGQLYRAQLQYACGIIPEVRDPEVRGIWRGIRHRMDKDAERYESKCQQMRANGSKRKQMVADATKSQQIESDNDSDNDNDIKKNTPKGVQKETKHLYGDHVLLTDEEYARLVKEYGESEANAAVEYLDNYIALKGYKAKSHYLAIRKWVFDAMREEGIKKQELDRREQKLKAIPKRGFAGQRTDDLDTAMQAQALKKLFG